MARTQGLEPARLAKRTVRPVLASFFMKRRPASSLFGLMVVAFGCAQPAAPPAPSAGAAAGAEAGAETQHDKLSEIPPPDLSAAAPAARDQVAALKTKLATLRADPQTPTPELARAYGDLGSVYLIYDFIESAAVAFANARALEPSAARWHYLLAYLAQLRGDLDVAARGYQQTLAREPGLRPATLRLGRVELERGNLEQARVLFAPLADDDNAAALEGLGKIAQAQGDTERAIHFFERALARAPKATSLEYALSQAYRKLGDRARARQHLDRRGDVPVRIVDPLIGGLGALGKSAQLFMVQAAEAMEDGDWAAAAGAYQTAIDRDPETLDAYRGLAVAVERLGDVDAAIGHLERGIARPPQAGDATATRKRADLERTLAGMLVLAGRDLEAIEHFRRVLRIDPAHQEVREPLANALARSGRLSDALALYDQVIRDRESPAPALLIKRATLLVNLGQGARARADFERAIAATPDDPALHLRFAQALTFLGEPAAADAERAAAARLAGAGDTTKHLRLLVEDAHARMARGEYESALSRFDQALELAPERHGLRFELAQVLGHLGYLDDALREFRAVADALPEHAGARRGEITVLLLSGRFGRARERLQDALQIFPLDAGLAHVQARLLATSPDPGVRDGPLALELAGRLMKTHGETSVRETFAMALAAAGRYQDAASLQRQLVHEAEQAGDDPRAGRLRARLHRFEAGKPWAAYSGEEIVAATLGGATGEPTPAGRS